MTQILARLETLYPLLTKQKLKESGKVHSQSFITPANGPAKGIFQNNQEAVLPQTDGLTLRERLKIISTLAKSEVLNLPSEEHVQNLEQAVLPALDQICQQTNTE